jgi:hypothetical protein
MGYQLLSSYREVEGSNFGRSSLRLFSIKEIVSDEDYLKSVEHAPCMPDGIAGNHMECVMARFHGPKE